MKREVVMLLACILVIADTVAGGDAKKDQAALQGTWKMVSMIEKGKKAPEADVAELDVVISGDNLSLNLKGKKVAAFAFKMDPAKKPKTIDFTCTFGDDKGKTDPGIYEITADTVRFCVNEEGKDRPKEFASAEKSPFSLFVMKKAKK